MNSEVKNLTQRIDKLFCIKQADLEDEVAGHFSRYLCVMVAGYAEESVRILLRAYVEKRSNFVIQRYVALQIQYLTNLKSNKLKDTLLEFNIEWGEAYVNLVSEDAMDALDSIVSNRHLIAHGKNSGISYETVKKYYDHIKNIILLIDTKIVNCEHCSI